MPHYDYRCTECGREVEVRHGIYESGPGACEHCGGAMRKALSSPAIHFKGKGWAKKDAATAKKASPPPSSSSGAGSSSDKSDGGKDASATKTEKADSPAGSAAGPEGKTATTTGNTSD